MVYSSGRKDGPAGRLILRLGWGGEKNFIRYGNLYLECITLVICGRNTNL